MKECSKSISRRLGDPRFVNKYFVGRGLDIGGLPDPLALYAEFFSGVESLRTWDWVDGDAQYLGDLSDESFDFIHSSHCLEHLVDPFEGLSNWFRVVRKGGYLVLSFPDEDLYEQGLFPSTFNKDHKWTFTLWKDQSWSSRSINVFDLVTSLGACAQPIKVELLDATYRYGLPRFDQTLTPVGECGIELIIRKRTDLELSAGGRLPLNVEVANDLVVHLNQYRDDLATLKEANRTSPPFGNANHL